MWERLEIDSTSALKPKFIGYRLTSEGGYVNDSNGGILYSAGIEGTSIANLPTEVRELLAKKRII